MANKKLLDRAKDLKLEVVEGESDEDLVARINEAQNAQEFDPTKEKQTNEELLADGKCLDCQGEGIRSPEATQVCQTCEGTGKA